MEPFLKRVARQILAEFPTDTDQVLVVFNNHRSEAFLRKHLNAISAEEQSIFFEPHTTVIDDLVKQLSGLEIVRNEFLLFELYKIHQQIGGEKPKYARFEDFISFGDLMIADFSEVDQYRVDARQLFGNLSDIKEVENWDVETPETTQFKRDYLQFYHSLYDYYSLLHERLQSKGLAYSGMAYRFVADHVDELIARCRYKHVYFVGFNALTECELQIIRAFRALHRATLITDADPYYTNSELQEAGYFLRQHGQEFAELKPTEKSCFEQGMRKVKIVECPENVMQCKYAGNILSRHPEWLGDPESTAVILADEKLLLPMLNSLPTSEVDYQVNVSMGYPYADSNIHLLVVRMISLYIRANNRGYYHSDVVELLSDLNIVQLDGASDLRVRTSHLLEKSHLIRCHAEDLRAIVSNSALLKLFPDEVPSVDQTIDLIEEVTEMLAVGEILENNKKEKQALAALLDIIKYLKTLQAEYHYIEQLDTLLRIYSRIAKKYSITFLGQPLSGLQIMGMLETRNLDFKRVLLLSANESTLPAGRTANTLIPYDLKRHFHLPTFEEKDSVYAHHFYRLLQRAEEVYLLYSSEVDGMGRGEESRFVKQVRTELAEAYPNNLEIKELVVDTNVDLSNRIVVGRKKTPEVMARLWAMAERGFAPTVINTYIDCPLRFYYEHVLGIKQKDKLDEEFDTSQIGNRAHDILKKIYSPFIGREVAIADLEQALKRLPDIMQEDFEPFYANGRSEEGRNRFAYSVVESQLRGALQKEIALLREHNSLKIIAIEPEEVRIHTLFTDKLGHPVRLGGRPDRIDCLNGQVRVIDYKTGSVNDKEISYAEGKDRMPGKWLQLMCYALVYQRTTGATSLQTAIFPLRYLNSDVKYAEWNGETTFGEEEFEEFEVLLSQELHEMLDPEIDFVAPEKPNGCLYCPIKSFCPDCKENQW